MLRSPRETRASLHPNAPPPGFPKGLHGLPPRQKQSGCFYNRALEPQGLLMQEFEIRILNGAGGAAIVTSEIHLNENSAIRSAKKLANGRPFEVWRGDGLVCGRTGEVAVAGPRGSPPPT